MSCPLLPVPNLSETCAKYLTTVRPFLSDEEYNNTVAAVSEFLKPGGQGETLQQRLLERAAKAAKFTPEISGALKVTSRNPISENPTAFRQVKLSGASSSETKSAIAAAASHDDEALSSRRKNFVVESKPDAKTNILEPTRNNWLIDWWNEYAYLDYREPVVLNVNYFFVLPDIGPALLEATAGIAKKRLDLDPPVQESTRTQTRGFGFGHGIPFDPLYTTAAAVVSAVMDFRAQWNSGSLKPDSAGKGASMCMNQYRFMFNTCRVPKRPSDFVKVFDAEENNHIVVARKNQFFSFELLIPDETEPSKKRFLTTAEIESQLLSICEIADNSTPQPPLGVLTCDHRDTWADNRKMLIDMDEKTRYNAELLETIESSVFLLCLDDISPFTREELGRACWHADGRNRWFDKSLQFIVFENGRVGFNGEHSMMDATPTARLCEFVSESLLGNKIDFQPSIPPSALPIPKRLSFKVPPQLIPAIERAIRKLTRNCKKNDFTVLRFGDFGKNVIKKLKCSPDAFVQMAFQLAFYRLYGTCAPTYESAGMRKYSWGRTETCRSVSLDSVSFVKAMADNSLKVEEKAAAARKAIQAQSSYMASCVQGKGIDRHLLGLRLLVYPWEPTPAIFLDPAYSLSSHWTLSTSQIPAVHLDGYGWGEVVPDGFGLAYMVKETDLWFNIVAVREILDDAEEVHHRARRNNTLKTSDVANWAQNVATESDANKESEGDQTNHSRNTTESSSKSNSIKFMEPPSTIKHGLSTTDKRTFSARRPEMDIGLEEDGDNADVESDEDLEYEDVDAHPANGSNRHHHHHQQWNNNSSARFFWASTKCERMRVLLESALTDLRRVLEAAPVAAERPEVVEPVVAKPVSETKVPLSIVTEPVKVAPELIPDAPLSGKLRSDSMGLSLAYPPRRRIWDLLSRGTFGDGKEIADTESEDATSIGTPVVRKKDLGTVRRKSTLGVGSKSGLKAKKEEPPKPKDETKANTSLYDELGEIEVGFGDLEGKERKSRWKLFTEEY
ncbi:Carnitine O-acetyltransferase mitochondrial [Nowakowskiella sp. JEL0407]|nr:Carnitine O-acetyltransferase mitochondrial [Nowakowskiella sp. JEL0407]